MAIKIATSRFGNTAAPTVLQGNELPAAAMDTEAAADTAAAELWKQDQLEANMQAAAQPTAEVIYTPQIWTVAELQ